MRGWESDDGWWFTYAATPTYRCPYGRGLDDDVLDHAAGPIQACAEALGMDYHKLARRVLAPHGWHGNRARTDNGDLTDRCAGCGAKMERFGFYAKVERPVREGEAMGTEGVSMRLTGEALRRVKEIHLPTKREIREWTYEEFQVHQRSLQGSDRS